jgi:hypothetical protein
MLRCTVGRDGGIFVHLPVQPTTRIICMCLTLISLQNARLTGEPHRVDLTYGHLS